MDSIARINKSVKTILDWATPKFNGRLLVTEGVIYGFVPDETVAQLAKFLKAEYQRGNLAIEAEPRRGYLINLDNGHTVGITRNSSGMRGRPWLAFCGQVSGNEATPSRPLWTNAVCECGNSSIATGVSLEWYGDRLLCNHCRPMTEAETERRQQEWAAGHEPDDYGLKASQ